MIRQYHGHLSGCYCLALHPTLDVFVTGGRDSVARVWDMRTKQQIFVLEGHKNTVYKVATQASDPQIITTSADSTVRLWDMTSGKASAVLTNHKKGVRAVTVHPREFRICFTWSVVLPSHFLVDTRSLPVPLTTSKSGNVLTVNSCTICPDTMPSFRVWL